MGNGHVRRAREYRSICHARLGKQLKAGSGKSSTKYLHAIHECGLVEDFLDRSVFLKKIFQLIKWFISLQFLLFRHWFSNFTDVHEKPKKVRCFWSLPISVNEWVVIILCKCSIPGLHKMLQSHISSCFFGRSDQWGSMGNREIARMLLRSQRSSVFLPFTCFRKWLDPLGTSSLLQLSRRIMDSQMDIYLVFSSSCWGGVRGVWDNTILLFSTILITSTGFREYGEPDCCCKHELFQVCEWADLDTCQWQRVQKSYFRHCEGVFSPLGFQPAGAFSRRLF